MKPVWYGQGDLAWLEPETDFEREWLEKARGETVEEFWQRWKDLDADLICD